MKNIKPIDDQVLVETYVLNKMSETEKASFQFRLMQNKALRQQVTTMRTLHKTVIAESRTKDGSSSNQSWIRPFLILLSLLMLIGIGWFGYQDASKKNTPPENTMTTTPLIQEETKIIEKNKPTTKNSLPSKEKSEITPPPVLQKPTKSVIKNKKPPPPLIAALNPADFAPNPYLEEFTAGVRSNEMRIELKNPTATSVFKIKNDQVQLLFDGTLFAKKGIPLRLILFSNKPADFDNNRPVLKTPLPLTNTTNGFTFSKAMSLELSTGLFYYIIENETTETPIFIGKIRIE